DPQIRGAAAELAEHARVRLVRLDVAGPFVVGPAQRGEAVQERPYAAVAEAGVVALAPRRRVVELRARDRLAVLDAQAQPRIALGAAPAQPYAVRLLERRHECRDQPADLTRAFAVRPRPADGVPRLLCDRWQPVR